MTSFKPGDVVLAPFPFTDQSAVKQRPAVVLSSERYNQTHPDVILAPITSQLSSDSDEVRISLWQQAGLLKPSAVKPIVSTFDVQLVKRRLGSLTMSDLRAVRRMFSQILNLR